MVETRKQTYLLLQPSTLSVIVYPPPQILDPPLTLITQDCATNIPTPHELVKASTRTCKRGHPLCTDLTQPVFE